MIGNKLICDIKLSDVDLNIESGGEKKKEKKNDLVASDSVHVYYDIKTRLTA